MVALEKVRASFVALFHKKQSDNQTQLAPNADTPAQADSSPINEPCQQNQDDKSEGDMFRALSEVSDREPVERLSGTELRRRPSLEQQLTNMAHSPHDEDGDMFEALSEVSSPEPCRRSRDDQRACQDRWLSQHI
jgi:hypothetical protein